MIDHGDETASLHNQQVRLSRVHPDPPSRALFLSPQAFLDLTHYAMTWKHLKQR